MFCVSTQPSCSSTGTAPAGLSARNSGDRRCSRLTTTTSNGCAVQDRAMWSASEQVPGEVYSFRLMRQGSPCGGSFHHAPAAPLPAMALAGTDRAACRDAQPLRGGSGWTLRKVWSPMTATG